jgi:hypothetical protein
MKLLNAPSLLTGGISVAVALLLLFVLPWILPQRGAPKPAPALATEENSHRAHLG